MREDTEERERESALVLFHSPSRSLRVFQVAGEENFSGVGGYVRQGGNLTQVIVLNAGHMVPMVRHSPLAFSSPACWGAFGC